jgi:hypothetical protein
MDGRAPARGVTAPPAQKMPVGAEPLQVRQRSYKATLREWRRDFARYLRDLGVEANATERAVREEVRPQKATGIHRAMRGVPRPSGVNARSPSRASWRVLGLDQSQVGNG